MATHRIGTLRARRHVLHGRPASLATVMKAALAGTVVLATITLAAVPTPAGAASSDGSRAPIPAAAFHDHTGLTSTSVRIGNISTETGGLFTGAVVGTEAYADYVNAMGGINHRKLIVDSANDNFAGGDNKTLTEHAVQTDFATVGGFSLEDSFGGTVLAANPSVPNVTETLSPTTEDLPNSFSPDPTGNGWPLGALQYFKEKFPKAITHVGSLTSTYGSAQVTWTHEKAAMHHLGYKLVYQDGVPVTQTDFTQNVIAMRDAGVKLLYSDQLPENYASAVIKALNQQDFHPIVVIGVSAYSEQLVPNSGGASAIDGAYFEMPTSLFLGEDQGSLPAVATFLKWVHKASPGFDPDFYTLAGWMSTELFSQALKAAGPNPSRGSVLAALRKINSFSGDNIEATVGPSSRTSSTCYVVGRIEQGKFERQGDPATTSATHGYRCDAGYFTVPS
jgi:ABC-type branched-subunit amino acid transport system substrate-binding protein